MKAGPRRSEDSQAWRSSRRRVSDEGLTGRCGREQSPRGLLPGGRSPRLPERVGPGLGVGPPRRAVDPLEGRCRLPDPRGQRFPQRRRAPSVLGEKPSAFLHAVPCRVLCVCVCVRAREAGRAHASGCTREPLGLALGGSLHQAEKQVKSPRGDWWEWCASHGPRWGVIWALAAADRPVLALRGCCRGRFLWVVDSPMWLLEVSTGLVPRAGTVLSYPGESVAAKMPGLPAPQDVVTRRPVCPCSERGPGTGRPLRAGEAPH